MFDLINIYRPDISVGRSMVTTMRHKPEGKARFGTPSDAGEGRGWKNLLPPIDIDRAKE